MRRKIGLVLLAAVFLMMPLRIQAVNTTENTAKEEETEVESVTEENEETVESDEEEKVILVTDIEIADHESELEVGKTLALSGTVLPSDATDSEITYRSSDTSIATVSSTGEVKGIRKGKVTITLSAGEITKEVSLTVKVATIGITLNKDYLVMKLGETYRLSAKVSPVEAKQEVIFRSADTEVATVSKNGTVTATGKGSTTIIVSNGDISVAVSVIVNEAVQYTVDQDSVQEENMEEKEYVECVSSAEQKVIDSEMLKYFYESKQNLRILGEGYVIQIDGADIVNFNNEFSTDISLVRNKESIRFTLNQGNNLCGAVTLYLEESQGKYLYLYNESKKKYELIETDDIRELELTTPGKYQILDKRLKPDLQGIVYVMIGGWMIVVIGAVIYVAVKRKYWFW